MKVQVQKNSVQEPSTSEPTMPLVARCLFGGALMGLANLVPGISGGTMLVAAGIYPKFIESIADLTKLRFRFSVFLVLSLVAFAAAGAILLGAEILKDLVVNHRWIMYSLFIGLTLGGVPTVWKLARPASPALIVCLLLAVAVMIGLAQSQTGAEAASNSTLMSVLAGLAGAAAMILPGLSGSYILLLMGQYFSILSALSDFKNALKAGDFASAMEPTFSVLVPVGIGVVLGVVMVGNMVQWLLKRYRKATLGALLGLLLGSTIGLWPFQQVVEPEIGTTVKGQVVTVENLSEIEPKDWPTEYFQPQPWQIGVSVVLVVVGFGLTIGVARIGHSARSEDSSLPATDV